MYAGHFAAGLALKARVPEAPTWGLLLGVGVLDILFGPLVIMGIERATLTPGLSPGFSLDYIDWSHSLATSLAWSILFAAAFARRGKVVALVLGFSVWSHFLLDLPMHPADLALWPGSGIHLGLGLWRILPIGWWFVEGAVVALACLYYWRCSRHDNSFGRHALVAVAVVFVLHLLNSPWLSAL